MKSMAYNVMLVIIFFISAFAVSVDAQGSCRASVNCAGAPGDELGRMTIEDCCLNTPAGLAFNADGSEICTPCIVFGFFNDSFIGVEQGPGHIVLAGWQKGAAQGGANLVLNVVNRDITARQGSSFDYTINTNQVRFLYRRPDPPEDVVFIFRMDAIAQEINETLTLELVMVPGSAALPTGDGVFFRNTITMTIIDNDAVDIFFTEDDFRANEAPENGAGQISFMPVRVIKTSRIANPIVLDVIPLTVDMARANTPPALPTNIPVNNPFSPPFADLKDFNNTVIRITFDPDENLPDNERPAPIPIVDDLVNEADEQVFIVQLRLIDSINSSAIDLTTRAASICRIINDDTIQIGFEVPAYTYVEPPFETTIDEFDFVPPTNLTANGPIYLVKEDNVVSEQTFQIVIQVTDSVPSGSGFNPSTLNADYELGVAGTSPVLQFRADQQRILFSFTLFGDTIPEGTEAFLATSAPEDSALVGNVTFDVPGFLPPTKLFSGTYVIIEDDDPIIIGFEETKYTVDESVGILEVYVSVFSPDANQELFAAIDLVIQTISTNATGGADYVELNVINFDVFLQFNDVDRRLMFQVTIIDDDLFESMENFNLELRFDPFVPIPSGVILNPNVSTVCILDDDNVTIGFINPPYSVFENESQLVIQVGVLEGSLEREVVVSFSTSDLTAVGGNDYVGIPNLLLTFGPASSIVDITVSINDDSVYELTEIFNAALSFPGDPLPRVTLSPDSAQITIVDEDVLSFGFEPTVYSVNEDAGSVALNINFLGDAGAFVPHVITSTVDGTATGSGTEADYTPIVVQQLSFTTIERSQDLTVQIVDDSFTEFNEAFSAVLSSVFLATAAGGPAIVLSDQERARLILNPDTAEVTITDNDESVIGFFNTNISILEDGGSLNFDIGVLEGNLRINVEVIFTTDDRSAHAEEDYNQTTTSLTFFGQSTASVPVVIIDDTLFETPETFVGLLSAVTLPSNVRLVPAEANATIIDNERVIIGFDPANYSVNEDAGTVTLTVRVLEGILSEEQSIPVRLITADDSAQAPSDYTSVSSVLTFTSLSTTQTVEVTIEDDSLLEINEVFRAILQLENSDDADRVQLQPQEASVTILDNDEAVIGFDPVAYNATEGTDLFVDLNVRLISGQLGRDVIVLFNTLSGSATGGLDYVEISGRQLIFSPSVSTQSARVTILDDINFEELVETFTAALTADVPRLSLLPNEATVDILDDDLVTFGFDQTQYSVVENASFVTVTIHQISGGQLNRNVFITLETGDGTAVSVGERDFEAHSVELTFGPGITEQEVMITIIDDLRLELDEQFNSVVSLTVTDPAVNLNPAVADITIIDNDIVVIGFNQTRYDVSENVGQSFVYVEVLNGMLRRQVVVNVFTADNTALAGSDYTSVGPTSLTFDMNNLKFPIPIDIINDEVHELDENFFGRLSTVDEDAVLEPSQTTVRILNDDVVTFTFRQPVYIFMENVGTGTVCVDKIGVTDQTITVTVNGVIQSGPFTRMLVFLPNENSSCIDFTVEDDIIALEDPEEFTWTLEPVPIPDVELGTNTTRIVIIDDDTLILNLEKSGDIPEASGTVQACVTFSNPFAREFEISPSVARPPNDTVPAIATPAMDYSDVIAPIIASPGATQACFDIVINDDTLVEESQECLMASFTAEELENLLIGESSSVCCIIDDDNVTIGFRPVDYSVNEDQGTVTLFVHLLDGELARAVEVEFSTQDGTATSSAPADYISPVVPITLQFTPDQTVQEVVISIINDDITETLESFIGLLTTTDGAVFLAPSTATVVISDNDEVVVGFDPETYEVSEGDGSVTLNVRLISGILEREVTVSFTTGPGSATSADPADYLSTTETLIFSPTVSLRQVVVQIIDDDIRENSETFFGQIAAQDDQPVITDPALAVVTILDNNDATVIGFEQTEYGVSEGGQTEVCAVLTQGTLEKQVEVVVTSSDVDANVDTDYIGVSQTLIFNATTSRVCFFTSTIEDDLLENDETYRLTLTSSEPGLTLNPSQATVTIEDDEDVQIGLTETVFVATEGGGVQVEVCARIFRGQLERNAVVTLQTIDGSAVSQGTELDYQMLSVQLIFTPSIDEICQNISIINDIFYEDPEMFNVNLTTTDEDVIIDPSVGTVTILDEDEIVIGFVMTEYSIPENGGQQQVCAEVVSGTLRTEVEVQFSTEDLVATAPDDYTETIKTLVFRSDMLTDCADIPINPDNIIEGTERFYANIATTADRVTLSPDQAVISIIEATGDLIIGFVDLPYETREESGFVTVSVAIISEGVVLDNDYVVAFETSDLTGLQNSAEAVKDYEPLTRNLTFSSTVKRIDFNVTIMDDDIVELDEVFSGSLSKVTMDPDGPTVNLIPDTARITILDEEDTVIIGVTETLITVNESVGVRQVCAKVFQGELERSVLVTLGLNQRTATPGNDYVMNVFELAFDESNSGPICNEVVIINDDVYEGEEELTFNLTTTDSSVILVPDNGVLIITDNDEVVLGWERDLYSVDESVAQAQLCAIILEGTLAVALPPLRIATRDGTATRGGPGVQQDYIPTPNPNQFTFSSTDMGQMCTNIPIVDDFFLEATIEDFFADLSFDAGQEPPRVTILPVTTEVEITDNDLVTIGFRETTYRVLEDAGNAELVVAVLAGSLDTEIVVNLQTTDDSAVSPNDYTSQNVNLTFSPSTTQFSIPVSIVDDTLDEQDIERFTASLTRVTVNPRVAVSPPQAEVLITDDDVVVIGFEETTYTTTENNTRTVLVCASIRDDSPQLAKTVEVVLMSFDGSAMAPNDYNSLTTTLTFDEDTSRQCVEFTGFEDDVVDPSENFTVTLTGGNDVILEPDTAVVIILDQIPIVVGFVERMYTFLENQLIGTIQVRKNEVSDVPFQVVVFGGPSTTPQIERSADAVRNVTITFMAGPSAPNVITINITITDDIVALEDIESYDVSLRIVEPAPNVVIGTHEITTVNVLDDDFVTVGFGSDGVTVDESSGQFRMCVVKNRVALQDITVTIVAQDVSATSNLDYSPADIPTTVTIPASDSMSCFTGPIIDDLIGLEPNESFTLTITEVSPVSDVIQLGIDRTTITIIDDDIVRVRYQEPTYLFREETGLATVCLIKDLATAVEVAVDSVTTEDSALDTLDYMGGTFSVNFGTGANDLQCIEIMLINDNIRENREDFFVDVVLNDMGRVRAGNPSRTTVGIEDTGIPANDTVIGDPLMTVPILVTDSDLQALNVDRVSLCYEIHGRKDTNFNLVTDQCASVNAHYTDVTNYLNVIDQIGVRAVDTNGNCKNIQVDVTGCAASIDGVALTSMYSSAGISVRPYSNGRVRITVPNCNELSLVMWVICETRTLEDPFGGTGVVVANMIKYVVTRGLNFGHRQAHGILGQFWNIPVSVEPFEGLDRNGEPVPERYIVNVTSTYSSETRSYTGYLYELNWAFERDPCLYVGNRQAGPIYEVKDPNDPIIEGRYSNYMVPTLFSEVDFEYGLFNEDMCQPDDIIITSK